MSRIIYSILFLVLMNIAYSQETGKSFSKGQKTFAFAFDYGFEVKGDEDINSIGIKLDLSRYHRDNFALGIESKLRRYKGLRNNVENNTFAIGLSYVVKYHFINRGNFGAFIDSGLGAIYSLDRFPDVGTQLNGQYYLGIGNIFGYSSKHQIILELRWFHSSNGSGSSIGNPSYDGLFISLGTFL